jgi:hypothetical protein
LGDPLFIAGCALYAANRWLIKPALDSPCFDNWFNDALLIPCALPVMLFVHRRLGLRAHDLPPTFAEIAGHFAGWTVLFEVVGPTLMRHTTGDPLDALAYAAGGLVASCWWRIRAHEL